MERRQKETEEGVGKGEAGREDGEMLLKPWDSPRFLAYFKMSWASLFTENGCRCLGLSASKAVCFFTPETPSYLWSPHSLTSGHSFRKFPRIHKELSGGHFLLHTLVSESLDAGRSRSRFLVRMVPKAGAGRGLFSWFAHRFPPCSFMAQRVCWSGNSWQGTLKRGVYYASQRCRSMSG